MQFLVKYEDSMQEYETLLAKNVANLSEYSKNQELSEPASKEKDRICEVMKSKLDSAQKNLTTLKTKYENVNQSYEDLNLSDPDFKDKYFLYLECQEILRLEFIDVIDKCKLINLCIDGILKGHVRLKHILAVDKAPSNEASKRLNPSKCPECRKIFLERAIMKRHLRLKHAPMPTDDSSQSNFDSRQELQLKQSATTTASGLESLEHSPTFSSKATNEIRLTVLLDQNEDVVCLKLLKCTECDTLFTDEDSLKSHLNLVHAPNHSSTQIEVNSEQELVELKESAVTASASKSFEHSPTVVDSDEIEKSILSSEQTNTNNLNCNVDVSVEKCNSTVDSETEKKKALVSSKKQNGISRLNADVPSVEEPSKRVPVADICNICHKKYYDRATLNRHIRWMHEKRKPYKCADCGKLFSMKCYLRNHIILTHMPNTSEHFELLPDKSSCNDYDRVFKIKRNLESHMKSIHLTIKAYYNCAKCGKSFASEDAMKRHSLELHCDRNSYSCAHCDYKSKSKKYLAFHLKKRHANLKMKVSSNIYGGDVTARISNPTTSLKTKKRKPLDTLKENETSSISDRDHSTPERTKCGESYSRGDAMKRHSLELHCDRNFYSCAHCDYKSKSKKCLAIHLKKRHVNLMMKESSNVYGGDVTARTASLKTKKRRRLDKPKENETSNCNHSTPERTKCDKSFARGDAVVIKRKRRSLEVRRNRKSYSCAYCDYQNKPKAFVAFHLKKKHANLKMKKSRDICGGVVTAKTSNPTTSLKIKKGKRLVKSEKNETFNRGHSTSERTKCGKSFSRGDAMNRHSIEMLCNRNSYSCAHCDYKSKSKKRLAFHLKKKHTNLKMEESRDICGGDVSVKTSDPTTSLMIKKRKRLDTSKENETPNLSKSLVCNISHRNIKNERMMKRHMFSHEGIKPFECAGCGKSFVLKQHMTNHIFSKHMPYQSRPYNCHICGKFYSDRSYLNRHKCLTTQSHQSTCKSSSPDGTKKNKNLTGSTIRKKVSDLSKSLVCNISHRNIKNERMMKRHMFSHEGIKPFECAGCGKSFTRKENMTRHIFSMHMPYQSRPYNCHICGKFYSNRGHLNSHKCLTTQSHQSTCKSSSPDGTKKNKNLTGSTIRKKVSVGVGDPDSLSSIPQVCVLVPRLDWSSVSNFNSRRFQNEGTLRTGHVLSHEGLEPFKCTECDKSFKRKYDLDRHIRACYAPYHTRPYGCKFCSRRYACLSHLNIHKRLAGHYYSSKLLEFSSANVHSVTVGERDLTHAFAAKEEKQLASSKLKKQLECDKEFRS